MPNPVRQIRPLSVVLIEAFEEIPDPRVERTRLHRLADILLLSLGAFCCGAAGFEDIEDWLPAGDPFLLQWQDLCRLCRKVADLASVFCLVNKRTWTHRAHNGVVGSGQAKNLHLYPVFHLQQFADGGGAHDVCHMRHVAGPLALENRE
jgi:hypothetical protein